MEEELPPGQVLVLVHTIPSLVEEFARLCAELLPSARLFHIVDEPLLERIRRRGKATIDDDGRLASHVELAEEIGASAVLVTCSTVSLRVEAIRSRFRLPIVKIDHAMAVKAVEIGGRVSVVATNPTTLEPTCSLLASEAQLRGTTVVANTRLVDGALAALVAGDSSTHDRLIERAVREEAEHADVVVLAQASMAQAFLTTAGGWAGVPVLSSPRLALEEVQRTLLGLPPANQSRQSEARDGR